MIVVSRPVVIHGSMNLHLPVILTATSGATASMTELRWSQNALKFVLQSVLLKRTFQSVLNSLLFILAILSLFSFQLLNSIGVLSISFVCFIRTSDGRWSDMSLISNAESNCLYNISLRNTLSMSVALVCVILLGLVIARNRFSSCRVSRNSLVGVWASLFSKSMLWSMPSISSFIPNSVFLLEFICALSIYLGLCWVLDRGCR